MRQGVHPEKTHHRKKWQNKVEKLKMQIYAVGPIASSVNCLLSPKTNKQIGDTVQTFSTIIHSII